MARAETSFRGQRITNVLTVTVCGALLVFSLYWGQALFIPLAIAVFLSFLLSPCVRLLERRGLSRIPAVISVVTLATLLLAAIVSLVAWQVSSLLADLPGYTDNIIAKIKTVQQLANGPTAKRLDRMAVDVRAAVAPERPDSEPPPQAVTPSTESQLVSALPAQLAGFFNNLAGFGLAIVLVVYSLIHREDLRNRLIRLAGRGRLTFTTKVVDDAARRISRYLLTQLCLNVGYGAALAVALFFVGMDYAILWGVIAAVMRYVPYIGPWIGALFPIAASLALFDGWWQPMILIGVFIMLELTSNTVLEPLLYGHSIGVSPVAFILSAAFWAFLWGPIGLVLAAPITVCLAVLGRNVPQLEAIRILLSDEPALPQDVSFYQRLLARDSDEATALVMTALEEGEAKASVFDRIVIPTLVQAERDWDFGRITDDDRDELHQAVGEILAVVTDRTLPPEQSPEEPTEQDNAAVVPIIGCPASSEADRLALEMLRQCLPERRWKLQVISGDTLAAELLTEVAKLDAPLVCVVALPPGGLTHTRYLCKRMRAAFPKVKLAIGRWRQEEGFEQWQAHLRESGADMVATTLTETAEQLEAWHSVAGHSLKARARAGRGQPAREGMAEH